MNWKFILRWALTFALCIVVWDLSVWLTNSVGLAFFMALGLLILIAIGKSFISDWMEKKREK